VTGKGYAAQGGALPVHDQQLEQPISATASSGGASGGWELVFESPSEQMGAIPTSVYVKVTSDDPGASHLMSNVQ
jgi:hypothetical protein